MNTYEHKKIPCWTSSMTLNMGPCVAPPAWFYGKNWLISWAKFRWNKLGQCLSLMNVTRLLVVIYPSSWKVANSWIARIDIRKRTNTYFVLLSETSVNLGVHELCNSTRHHPQSFVGGVWHLPRHELFMCGKVLTHKLYYSHNVNIMLLFFNTLTPTLY
jgi:hypothetical protein